MIHYLKTTMKKITQLTHEKEKDQNDAEFNIVESGIDSFNKNDNLNQTKQRKLKEIQVYRKGTKKNY